VGKDSVLLHGDKGYTWLARDAQQGDMTNKLIMRLSLEQTGLSSNMNVVTRSQDSSDQLISGNDPYDLNYHKGAKMGQGGTGTSLQKVWDPFQESAAHSKQSP